MHESVGLRDHRLSLLDRRGDGRHGAARSPDPVRVSSDGTFDRAAEHGWLVWASPTHVRLAGGVPRCAAARRITPLAVIGRIVTAIRLWRTRVRSHAELRELNNDLLKDIGLRREGVGYEFPKSFSHCN